MLQTIRVGQQQMAALALNPEASGDPIILLHGITHSVYLWAHDPTFTPYGPTYSLSLPDHFPAVGAASERPLRAEAFAKIVAESIRTITGGKPATLVGLSTGGFATLAVAATAPELVKRVVCISGFAQGRWSNDYGLFQTLARSGFLGHLLFRMVLRRATKNFQNFYQGWRIVSPQRSFDAIRRYPYFEETVKAMYPAVQELSPEAMIAAFAAFPEVDITSWLSRISAPTLIAYGDADPVVSPAQAALIRQHIRHAETFVVAGGGHCPHFEEYERFKSSIAAFMQR